MERYKVLVSAMKILEQSRFEVFREEGTNSPAWSFLFNAHRHLSKQAEKEFRAEAA